MRENRDFVVPVNILTTFARAPFSWAARHTTVCLDLVIPTYFLNTVLFLKNTIVPNSTYMQVYYRNSIVLKYGWPC